MGLHTVCAAERRGPRVEGETRLEQKPVRRRRRRRRRSRVRRIVREVGFWLPLVFVLLTLLLSAGFVKVMELGQGRRDLERADRKGRSSARSIPGSPTSHLPAVFASGGETA